MATTEVCTSSAQTYAFFILINIFSQWLVNSMEELKDAELLGYALV